MLLARMADALYWVGRYLERAEDVARVVAVHGETHVDLPVGEDVGWWPLIELTGTAEAFSRRRTGLPSPPGAATTAGEDEVVAFVLQDRDNPSSVLYALAAARANLRRARPAVPRELWERCNELWVTVSVESAHVGRRGARVRWLREVVERCQQMGGLVEHAMRRDEALAFLGLGHQIERADLTCRVLAAHAETALSAGDGGVYDEVRRSALLRSLCAYQPYRRTTPVWAGPASVARYLLQDPASPGSVAACLTEARELLKGLPRNEPVLAAATDAAVAVGDAALSGLGASALREVLAHLQGAIAEVHAQVECTYLLGSLPLESPATAESPRRRGLVALGGGGARRHPSTPSAQRPATMGPVSGWARYEVVHRTTYDYDAPVEHAFNEAHLTPREWERQWVSAHEIVVEPAAETFHECSDLFGNTMVTFSVAGRFEHLSVAATSEVAVARPPAPPKGPPWDSVRRLLEMDRQPAARDARRFRAPSRLVPASPAMADYAAASFPPGRPVVEAVLDLTSRIAQEFSYEPGFTTVSTPVADVLEHRRGVCQDFAHLAIGCLRSVGLAARYVSGYIENGPPGPSRLVGADASHAWVSFFLPGWGWIDVDPTNDQLVGEAHVTTAWGRDYLDVSPLRGSVEGGGASHHLEVAVEVSRLSSERAAG